MEEIWSVLMCVAVKTPGFFTTLLKAENLSKKS